MSRNIVITGASAGIGRELARVLTIDRGAKVLATARRVDRLDELARELPEGRFLYRAGDLADPSFRETLWNQALELPGGVDVLINNAGVGWYSEFDRQDPAQIRRMIEVDLVALVDLTQKAIVHMKERGHGKIIEVSSILGFFGAPYSAVYTACKHAVNGLVKSLRRELKGSGVEVWCVCPGRTESEFHSAALGETELREVRGRGAKARSVAIAIADSIDRRHGAFVYPDLRSWFVTQGALWAPRAFNLALDRAKHKVFADQIQKDRPPKDQNG